MPDLLSLFSVLFLPILITVILIYGMKQKVSIYDAFIEGAKDGLKTCVDILPFLIGIFSAIEALTCSGAMDFIKNIISPLFHALGIPEELISVILLRPVSGSGALVVVEKVMEQCGPDSFAGRSAAVMVGSCETIFYVLALYFSVTAVKKMRHAFLSGIIGYLVGILASVYICRIL